ncbi:MULTISPECIES: hypothetical protein [unclassified Rhizobium]|uniref:hypothetical protein n=1 Tax=unclassified Rhizobium TaxID=2613769 RepID=UPI000DD73F5C|nr:MULTISPECIES: hypothetical protein [unclassified Rhizobium]MDM9646163.1 hypothetical protein [Rhizobium sp. S163]
MTNIRARHAGGLVAEIMLADRTSLRTSSPDTNDASAELERGFDLLFFLREMDILADELAKLAPSMDRTALELRLAQMRQVFEFRHKQRTDQPEVE